MGCRARLQQDGSPVSQPAHSKVSGGHGPVSVFCPLQILRALGFGGLLPHVQLKRAYIRYTWCCVVTLRRPIVRWLGRRNIFSGICVRFCIYSGRCWVCVECDERSHQPTMQLTYLRINQRATQPNIQRKPQPSPSQTGEPTTELANQTITEQNNQSTNQLINQSTN